MNPDALITSMFVRRLVLIASALFIGSVVLMGQLYRLTVVHGAEHRVDSERVLIERQFLETVRGRIFDRKGRVLAEDRPSFDVLVDYRVISGAWATAQAGREARRALADQWDSLNRAERERRINQTYRPRYDREVERLWDEFSRLADVPVSVIEDRCERIRDKVERTANYVWKQWQRQRQADYQVAVSIDDVKKPIREQRMGHAVLDHIAPELEAEFLRLASAGPRLADGEPAITIQPAGEREYAHRATVVTIPRDTLPAPLRADTPITLELDGIAAHIVGAMRDQVYKEDQERRPIRDPETNEIIDLGGYKEGDRVGNTGIESAAENALRGLRGIVTRRLDTGYEERTDPRVGRDVQLTIDIRLQARVKGILQPVLGLTRAQPWHGHESQLPAGTPLAASAVVIDVDSGDILALVSHSPQEWDDVVRGRDGSNPFEPTAELNPYSSSVNRAATKPYPCGSIVKPLLLCAALTEGVVQPNEVIECGGHFYPNDPEHFRCWIFRPVFGFATHGPLAPIEAIARSCNIFFYTVGDRLGRNRISHWYGQWGLQNAYDIGIPTTSGLIKDASELQPNEVIMMGIGQGPVAWTPLHAANAYATLARAGLFMEPRLMIDPVLSLDRDERDLRLDPQAVPIALEGLSEVIHNSQYGGARHIDVDSDPESRQYEPIFNHDSVLVIGKTGTAQMRPWPRYILDIDPDGNVERETDGTPRLIEREIGTGAHGWFVGLVGPNPSSAGANESNDAPPMSDLQSVPKYAIAVLVEWGGSGSRSAGPIANQIVRALIDEGYLP